MALYVAIYDIHPGDRKHFERMLTRISDRRTKESDILYIESYGSIEALLKTPYKYDTIIIDGCTESDNGTADIIIADKLRHSEIAAPLALYLMSEDEPSTENLLLAKSLENIRFYNKSIKDTDLTDILKIAADFQYARIPRIELRDSTDTYFVLPDEILYGKMVDSFMNITLTDGKVIRIIKDIFEFAVDLDGYSRFIQVGKDTILNLSHVQKKLSHAFLLDNGELISYSFFESGKITKLYEKFKGSQ